MDIETASNRVKDVSIQLKSENGERVGDFIRVPRSVNPYQLRLICNALLQKVSRFLLVRVAQLLQGNNKAKAR